MDNLSVIHFKAVQSEIAGRFLSAEEAERLKEEIDRHTVTDEQIRILAAQSWADEKIRMMAAKYRGDA